MSGESREEIRLTQEMVRIESSNPGTYEGAMAGFVYDWLRRNTSARVLREPVHPGRDNIVAVLRGASRAHDLTYICHMDTMPAGEGWDRPPFGAEIAGGKLYGRGACDMKAGLAAAMIAFRNISRLGKPPAFDFQLIATVNEEDAMTGAEQAVRDGYVNADSYVLDAEPTDSRIQVGHKGKTWFALTTRGRTCHASMPQRGCDAIAAMAEIITRINRGVAELPVHPEMGPCTAVIAAMTGCRNCMSFGPGSLEQAHRPNEFVPCEEITRSAAVMTRLAEEILL